MRPVNLIPPEQRRGAAAPSRTGSLSYVLVGVLAVVLIGVTASVVFGNKVSDRKDEVAVLEAKAAETSARAESLAAYTTFQGIHDARVETVTQLATSRFDWQRVLQELAKVLPRRIWLTNLTGSVGPRSSFRTRARTAGSASRSRARRSSSSAAGGPRTTSPGSSRRCATSTASPG